MMEKVLSTRKFLERVQRNLDALRADIVPDDRGIADLKYVSNLCSIRLQEKQNAYLKSLKEGTGVREAADLSLDLVVAQAGSALVQQWLAERSLEIQLKQQADN